MAREQVTTVPRRQARGRKRGTVQARAPKVQNQKERKLFAAASQALFRVQEKHQIEHVWVSFHTFWDLTFFIDENCKITEPIHFWTRAL
jgi:hypothetical protein